MEPNNYKKPRLVYIGGERINKIRDDAVLLQKANQDTGAFIDAMMTPTNDINIASAFENAMRDVERIITTVFTIQNERVVPLIEKVIFNEPATIVFWSDGTKTVVKANDEPFDREKGLAMAIAKKAMGNRGNYFNDIKKWVNNAPYYSKERPMSKEEEFVPILRTK